MAGNLTIGNLILEPATVVAGVAVLLLGVLLVMALGARKRAIARADNEAYRADQAAIKADEAGRRADEAGRKADEATRQSDEAARVRTAEMQTGMGNLMRAQGEINGQVRGLSERLEGFGKRVGESMSTTANKTHEDLSKLGERLAVIDKAQATITTLSSQVVELQHILSDKQTRGAYGQARMEAIVREHLPTSGYRFQPTLKNNTRPDCLILFPNGTPALVVDAKFPLEAWNRIRSAESPEATKAAESQFRRDTVKHIQDIAERYFVPGETQDTAFMFVPSESIFADIHEHFEDVIQRAHRARVVIVSPSLLMLSIQVVMSLLRDARMREQAHVIQEEVMRLMEDVGRLDDRVRRLQTHFIQTNKDIDDILISTRKVTGRGTKIQAVEIADEEAEEPKATPLAQAASKPRDPLPELPFNQIDEL
jgi:DNA recombination protein RmuC